MTRKGALGILYENERVDVTDRSAIVESRVDHGNVVFIASEGVERGYVVKSARVLSNQDAFLMNVSRLISNNA